MPSFWITSNAKDYMNQAPIYLLSLKSKRNPKTVSKW